MSILSVNVDNTIYARSYCLIDGNTLELLSNKDLHEQKSKEALEWSKKWSLPDLTNTLVEYYEEAIEIRKNR